jgi:glycosyltransferase involved in cell wall biosynthesis
LSAARVAVVLHTPADPQSAVYISYTSLRTELEGRGGSLRMLTPNSFPRLQHAAARWMPLWYPVAVARWVRSHASEFDVVVYHSFAGWLALTTGARRSSIVAFHGVEPLYHAELREEAVRAGRPLSSRYRLLQEWLMPRWLSASCGRAAAVTCLNSAEREFVERARWAPADRIRVVAHGVPHVFFALTRAPRPVRRLLFVGQWLDMKGIRYLSAATGHLLRRHEQLSLVCAGTLAGRDDVLASFDADVRARIDVRPRVRLEELPAVYAEADVFLFPSLYEAFGRALAEAMASRLPIVTTRVGVAMDALRDGESCLVVPKRDATAMCEAVERLLASPDLRVRLGDSAHSAAAAYRERDRVRSLADWLAALGRHRGILDRA